MKAIPDLAGLALCFVAMALILAAVQLAHALAGAFDIGFLGVRPFHGIATSIHNHVIAWLNEALQGVEGLAAKLFNDLTASLELFAALTALLGYGIFKGLEYLWNHAFAPRVSYIADGRILRAASPVIDIAGIKDAAVTAAKAIVHAAVGDVRATAQHAEVMARDALQEAHAAAAKAAGSVVNEISQVVNNPTTYITETVTEVVPGLAEALVAAGGEVADLPGITVGGLEDLLRSKELGTIAGLAAAIPLLRAITTTVVDEAGLTNAECRGKVKQICATDPSAWGNLLGGLAALGFAFSLAELVHVAEPLIENLAPVIRKAA